MAGGSNPAAATLEGMTVKLRPLSEVAASLGLPEEAVVPVGRHKAKVTLPEAPPAPAEAGRLVLVSAITPTRAGEGKTTVSVGLADGLQRLGVNAVAALREPSLGPVFGIKGGGTGGGEAQVEPASDINLHFTGDLHAITSAHNLLAALAENDVHFGGPAGLTPETLTWPRALDMNDRALRQVAVAHGRPAARVTRFDITAASEIMAVMALARSADDLRERLARIVLGTTVDGTPVTAASLGAVDALLALLQEALLPNLVQTRAGTPAFVHMGPFGNIAHGCSSVTATTLALRHADVTVTEAGFGFELGAEKFLHLKARAADVWPDAVVLVATVQALLAHGGGDLRRGLRHLDRQFANVRAFGLPVVVALNVFPSDTEEQLHTVAAHAETRGVPAARITSFSDGAAGGTELAAELLALLGSDSRQEPRFLYAPEDSLPMKLGVIAGTLYGAAGIEFTDGALEDLARLEQLGLDRLPVCIAKTHLSFSGDPAGGGLAEGFTLTFRELRLSAGAGFIVALAGNIITMPALPRVPAALNVRVGPDGTVSGLMQDR